MAFDSELAAFQAYAAAQPHNCSLLVDTYDSLTGVRHAIEVARSLAAEGGKLAAIRLDSGDLAWLSIEARKLLDAAGLPDTQIIASNDLDEHLIESLIQQGAAIDAWGVGTKLVTAYDEPALTGVYKLSMIKRPGGELTPRIKLSEQAVKISNPGVQQIRRFSRDGRWVADAIYDELSGCGSPCELIDPFDTTRQRVLGPELASEDLLSPVWKNGSRLAPPQPLAAARERTQRELQKLDPTVRRLLNPHQYPVGLCANLYAQRMRLVQAARKVL
jgi:nicotinate phosphoribosyltransferase